MDNQAHSAPLQKMLEDVFTYPAPEQAFLTSLENQLRHQMAALHIPTRRERWQAAFRNAFQPMAAVVGAAILLTVLIVLAIKLLPSSTIPGIHLPGEGGLPTPRSALTGSFVWQTDGKYGYRMLRPAGWEAVDGLDHRLYSPAGSRGQADRVFVEVYNLQTAQKWMNNQGGMLAQWELFKKDPSLDGWARGLEQNWATAGIQSHFLKALPQARIYFAPLAAQPEQPFSLLMAFAVDQGQPLMLGLYAYGKYADRAALDSLGLMADFETMAASLGAAQTDPTLTDPPLADQPQLEPSPAPTLRPTATAQTAPAVMPSPQAYPAPLESTPAASLTPGQFVLQYYPPLVMDYDPQAWIDKSEPANKDKYINFLQSEELTSCTIGVNLPSGLPDIPREKIQLGEVNYDFHTIRDSSTSPEKVTQVYFANRLAGADYRIGIPMPMISADASEWAQCKSMGEAVLATLHADLRHAPLWRQYEYTLAAAILGPDSYPSRTLGNGLCEWEIYGRTSDKVYGYALCQDATSDQGTAGSVPVVIHLSPDGSIGPVDLPKDGTEYYPSIQALFPPDLWDRVTQGQAAFTFNAQAAEQHIASRRPYPEAPPQIVVDGVELPTWTESAPSSGSTPAPSPESEFPPEVYPAPLPFEKPTNGAIANGCPDLIGVEAGSQLSLEEALSVLNLLSSANIQQFKQVSDQAYWPLPGTVVNNLQPPKTEQLEVFPATNSPYAGVLTNACGQETLDLSWSVKWCSDACSNYQRSISLDSDYFLINRQGHWLVWAVYP